MSFSSRPTPSLCYLKVHVRRQPEPGRRKCKYGDRAFCLKDFLCQEVLARSLAEFRLHEFACTESFARQEAGFFVERAATHIVVAAAPLTRSTL
jgi:hypothetical protein